MPDDILQSVYLDVREVLEDLRLHWLEGKGYKYNPTALTKIKDSGDNLMFCCPFHHESNPSCGILKEYPYIFQCFGCEASGNLGQFVARVLDLPNELYGIRHIMRNYIVVDKKSRPPINIEEILDGKGRDRKRALPDEVAEQYAKKRHVYMYERGFSEPTLRRYEIGFDEELRAVTFPVRTSDGRLRFIKKRFVDRKGFLNEKNIEKKDIVYGLYYVRQAPKPITELFVNESETDTLACYEGKLPAVAILGRIMFKEQVMELVRAGVKTVNLFFDNDKPGVECTLKSAKLISTLTPIKINVVIYPDGHYGIDSVDKGELPYKDANDLLLAGKLKSIKVIPFEEFLIRLKESAKIEFDFNEI